MIVEHLPCQRVPGFVHQQRSRIHSGDRHARVFDDALRVFLQRRRDSGERVVDRSPEPQLLVDAIISSHAFRQEHPCQHLVVGKLHARVADIGVELGQRQPALAGWPGDLQLRFEA